MAQARAYAEPDAERPEVVLVSAMRNEGPFILEWLAYHRVIGIGQVVIVSTGSTDGSDDLLAALAAAGEVTFLRTRLRRGVTPQEAAVRAFEDKVGYREGAWYLFLDADEFLNVHVGDRTVQSLVTALSPASAAMLNWRLFGSGGNDTFPGRYVSPAFVAASRTDFVANMETKPLFRAGEKFEGFSTNAYGLPRVKPGVTAEDCLGGNGKPLDLGAPRTRAWLDGQPVPGRNNLASRREYGWALAQVNHYAVRTPDHFRLKDWPGPGKAPTLRQDAQHTPAYFDRFDRGEAEDRSILHWESAVTAEIERLRKLPGIAKAEQRVARLVAAALAELDRQKSLTPPGLSYTEAPQPDPGIEPEQPAQSFDLTFAPKERSFVIRHYEAAESVLEYGSGGSTVMAARLGLRTFSVESDADWAARMAEFVAPISDKVHVHHADIGPTGAWGAPLAAESFRTFHAYALSVWDLPAFVEPDLVLIDGRFRAACLVAVMLRATRPVTVLFDDYVRRSYYHGVERLARLEETVGRMARFTVTPGAIPPEMVTEAIGWFTDPR